MTKKVLFGLLFGLCIIGPTYAANQAASTEQIKQKPGYTPFSDSYKKYGITVPKPGEYPVKIFTNDQVPLPTVSGNNGRFHWVTNDKLIYVMDDPAIDYLKEKATGISKVIELDLNTFKRNEIAKVPYGSGICYDTLSKRIIYTISSYRDPFEKNNKGIVAYGILGKKLDHLEIITGRRNPNKVRTNPYDCVITYPYTQPIIDGFRMRPLRTEDGIIGEPAFPKEGWVYSNQDGEFLYISPKGEKKTFNFGYGGNIYFDIFSNQYWLSYQLGSGRDIDNYKLTFIRFDRRMNVMSKKTYPYGPWPLGNSYISVRNGYLIYRPLIHEKPALLLLKNDGHIVEVLRDDGLTDEKSISPDGCKVAYIHREGEEKFDTPKQFAVLNLCTSGDKQ